MLWKRDSSFNQCILSRILKTLCWPWKFSSSIDKKCTTLRLMGGRKEWNGSGILGKPLFLAQWLVRSEREKGCGSRRTFSLYFFLLYIPMHSLTVGKWESDCYWIWIQMISSTSYLATIVETTSVCLLCEFFTLAHTRSFMNLLCILCQDNEMQQEIQPPTYIEHARRLEFSLSKLNVFSQLQTDQLQHSRRAFNPSSHCLQLQQGVPRCKFGRNVLSGFA